MLPKRNVVRSYITSFEDICSKHQAREVILPSGLPSKNALSVKLPEVIMGKVQKVGMLDRSVLREKPTERSTDKNLSGP